MSIALATRGYICPRFVQDVIVQLGDGPTIIDQQVLQPDIDGGVQIEAEGPTITGSIQPGPEISTTSGETDTGLEPPSISGSDKPKIS